MSLPSSGVKYISIPGEIKYLNQIYKVKTTNFKANENFQTDESARNTELESNHC